MTDLHSKPKVLEGIRVVDFCHGGVGPCMTTDLADAGAEVIKVETHTRTEVIRRAFPFKNGEFHVENSASFQAYNHGKLGITLNLKHPKGVELAKRLIAISDVVADSFTPNVMKRLGLGYEDLKKIKPDIIQIGMSFAGETGPYAHQRGHGPILAALSGIPGLVGWEGGPPMAPSLAYTDHYLPEVWAVAVMRALIHRDETGEGQFIDASDLEGAIDVLDTGPLEYVVNGRGPTRLGNRHSWASPHGCYQCQGEDRWCAIAIFDDEEWKSLCRALEMPALATDERFATFASRKKNEDSLDEIVGGWTRGRDPFDVMHVLQAAGVRAGVVQNATEMINDPQLKHRNHFWDLAEDPDAQWFTFETEGYLMSETPLRITKRAPRLGEDNDYVFHDLLGLSDDEMASLVAEGAID